MIELGILLADMVMGLDKESHDAFYRKFNHLARERSSAAEIAEGLLDFIAHDPNHPAYEKLQQIIGTFPHGEQATDVHARVTVSTALSVHRIMSEAEDDDDFVDDEGIPYRRSSPTIVDDRDLNEASSHDRVTLRPDEISFDETPPNKKGS